MEEGDTVESRYFDYLLYFIDENKSKIVLQNFNNEIVNNEIETMT